jgi:hypothetical protein
MSTPQVDAAIAYAESKLGDPYRYGATGPDAFDCSGLVQASYAAAGVKLSRTTYTQVLEGQPVNRDQLQPGDLVFPDPGHVQLYVGNGEVIEAPHTGASVREVPMWGFWAARRIPGGGWVSAGAATAADAAAQGAPVDLSKQATSGVNTIGMILIKGTFVALGLGLAVLGGVKLASKTGTAKALSNALEAVP